MTLEQINQTLQVLLDAINVAQKRGAYTLKESFDIYTAIQAFNEASQQEEKVETKV